MLENSEVQESDQPKYELLSSGKEFFDDIIDKIGQAHRFIIIKSFLWRNDETGQMVANALKEAADKGIKVLVIKDRMGAFYEYSEGNGQSFFHDDPLSDSSIMDPHSLRSVNLQAKWMAGFYKNGVKPTEKNPLRQEMVEHNDITVIDQYKTYDHSKVIMIDDETSYVGGINFGDEYHEENEETFIDYMLKINGEKESEELLKTITHVPSGGPINDSPTRFVTDAFFRGEAPSMHQQTLDFINQTREKIRIAIPYFGHPDYIEGLTNIINQKHAEVSLLMPERPNVHGARNAHFVKRLRRETSNSDKLNVSLIPQMFHGKMAIRDEETAFFGSHNLATDESVFDELNIETSEPSIVKALNAEMDGHFQNAESSNGSPSWPRILPASRIEYLSVKLQTLMRRLRESEIIRARAHCRYAICDTYKKSC